MRKQDLLQGTLFALTIIGVLTFMMIVGQQLTGIR